MILWGCVDPRGFRGPGGSVSSPAPACLQVLQVRLSRYMHPLLNVVIGSSCIADSEVVAEVCMYQVKHSSVTCHFKCARAALAYVSLCNSAVGPCAYEHTSNTKGCFSSYVVLVVCSLSVAKTDLQQWARYSGMFRVLQSSKHLLPI